MVRFADCIVGVGQRFQPAWIGRRRVAQLPLNSFRFGVIGQSVLGRFEVFDNPSRTKVRQAELILKRRIVGMLFDELLVINQRFLEQLLAQILHSRLIEQRIFADHSELIVHGFLSFAEARFGLDGAASRSMARFAAKRR